LILIISDKTIVHHYVNIDYKLACLFLFNSPFNRNMHLLNYAFRPIPYLRVHNTSNASVKQKPDRVPV